MPGLLRWLILRMLPPVLALIGMLLLWQVLIWVFDPPVYVVCGPLDVWQALHDDARILRSALWVTLQGILIGYAITLVSGVLLAIVLDQFKWLERAMYPYTVFLQTVPLVAIAPALAVWLDFGLQSVVICVWVVSVFPMITGALTGLKMTEKAQMELFHLYGASWWARLWKLRLPSALPGVLTGMKVAAGMSVIGAVVAEFFVGQMGENRGLGVIAAISGENMPRMFAAVFLASMAGLVMLLLINLLQWLLTCRWMTQAKNN